VPPTSPDRLVCDYTYTDRGDCLSLGQLAQIDWGQRDLSNRYSVLMLHLDPEQRGAVMRMTAAFLQAHPEVYNARVTAVWNEQFGLAAAGMGASFFRSNASSMYAEGPADVAPVTGRAITNDRPVIFDRPAAGSTAVQDAQIRAHVEICNAAYCAGYLSPTGRVSTAGELTQLAGRAAKAERVSSPDLYDGMVVGHGPDTTWTGRPIPFKWQPLDQSVNASLGAQAAANYPIGYKPTGFWFVDDYVSQFGALPGQ
jgi:hypothetical protein